MKMQFIYDVSRYTAKKILSWATVVAKCDGGYVGFESWDDYRTWKNTK